MAHKITTSHTDIQNWAEERAAQPAKSSILIQKGKKTAEGDTFTGRANTDLTFIFTDTVKESSSLRFLDWEQFFKIFEKQNLALMYDDEINSEFYTFIPRLSIEEQATLREHDNDLEYWRNERTERLNK